MAETPPPPPPPPPPPSSPPTPRPPSLPPMLLPAHLLPLPFTLLPSRSPHPRCPPQRRRPRWFQRGLCAPAYALTWSVGHRRLRSPSRAARKFSGITNNERIVHSSRLTTAVT